MSTTNQHATYHLAEVYRRIRRSLGANQQLEGLRFRETFHEIVEKADDLPRVYVVSYEDDESIFAGGAGMNSPIAIRQTVTFQLVCDRRNGWLTDSTVTNVRKMGAINVKNTLIDEIERDDFGQTDSSLGGTIERPIQWEVSSSGIFDLGIVIDVRMTVTTKHMPRAIRSCLVETAP